MQQNDFKCVQRAHAAVSVTRARNAAVSSCSAALPRRACRTLHRSAVELEAKFGVWADVLLACRVLGAGNKNLSQILQVIVQVLSKGHDLATEDTVRAVP